MIVGKDTGIEVALRKAYGSDDKAIQAVLQVFAAAIHDAHRGPSPWCWTLSTPNECIMRLNLHEGTSAPKEALTLRRNGNVEFIVDKQMFDENAHSHIDILNPSGAIELWETKTKKIPERYRVIIDRACLGNLLPIQELVRDAHVKMIATHAYSAKSQASPSRKAEHQRGAVEFMRQVLNDATIPDPDSAKLETHGEGPRQQALFNLLSTTPDVPDVVARDLEAYAVEDGRLEGRASVVLTNTYERNSKNRVDAIVTHGTSCQVCGFSFGTVYGKHGEGYIEVHHKKPISSYGGEVVISPVNDLAVVCANCHRMIHRQAEHPLSIDDLRNIMTNVRDSTPID